MQKKAISRIHKDQQKLQRKLTDSHPKQWQRLGRDRAYALFNDMVASVPAYQKFLQSHGLENTQFSSFDQLKFIPAVDKDNYLKKYSRKDLTWSGSFGKGSWTISSTSGSTGQPYYFPRQHEQDMQYAITAEQYLVQNFSIDAQKTLYIVAFPMGAWIGGVFTYEAIKIVADKGYDLSIITPGIHKQEIINAIKQLASEYDQVILGAYAPFLRDILEDGERDGIDWSAINVKFVFSAEAFSEQFRDYVADKAKLGNIFTDTLNHYGTVDIGTMAHETPLSIAIRRELVDKNLLGMVFHEGKKEPTLCQFDPSMFYFEEKDKTLYCSAYSGIPLFRYDLKDYGGVISYKKMETKLKAVGISLDELKNRVGSTYEDWKLPFVYVYERNDFSVSYYAFYVYPEPIKKALIAESLREDLTGKFTMSVEYEKGLQKLYIVAEKVGEPKRSEAEISFEARERCHEFLMRESSEYPELFAIKGDTVLPVIRLRPYEDKEYFQPGRKQRWVIK